VLGSLQEFVEKFPVSVLWAKASNYRALENQRCVWRLGCGKNGQALSPLACRAGIQQKMAPGVVAPRRIPNVAVKGYPNAPYVDIASKEMIIVLVVVVVNMVKAICYRGAPDSFSA
jgi:hypothetical protein